MYNIYEGFGRVYLAHYERIIIILSPRSSLDPSFQGYAIQIANNQHSHSNLK